MSSFFKFFFINVFCIAIILCDVGSVSAIKSGNNRSFPQNESALYFRDLDDYGRDLEIRTSKSGSYFSQNKSQYKINKIYFDANKIHLSGVLFAKKAIDFNISGTLAKSEKNNNLVVIEAKDESNNFDVVFMGIDKNPKDSITLNPNVKNTNSTVLKLYLLEKKTRNFTAIESASCLDQPIVDKIFKNLSILRVAEHKNEFWYGKILKPISAEEIKYPQSRSAERDKISKKQYFRCTYSVGGGKIYEDFVVKYTVSGPSKLIGESTFLTKLSVYNEETWSNDIPSVKSDDTCTSIGVNSSIDVIGSTEEDGHYIEKIEWDSCHHESGKIDFSLSWCYTIPHTGITLNATFEPDKDVEYDKFYSKIDEEDEIPAAKVSFEDNVVLRDVGHSVAVNFLVGDYDRYDSGDRKDFKVIWNYDLYNSESPYHFGGDTVKEITFDYKAN
jgi:hypothetical protein